MVFLGNQLASFFSRGLMLKQICLVGRRKIFCGKTPPNPKFAPIRPRVLGKRYDETEDLKVYEAV
jgi:hypothetical protein